jgi:formate hydrogenlyase subunit 3/multisubunit Na+/H+ antiporter MnhD subunit
MNVVGNPKLEKAVVLAPPVALLLGFSIVRIARARTLSAFLQLLGTGCLIVVVLTHVAEALHVLPSMGWGEPHSIGTRISRARCSESRSR